MNNNINKKLEDILKKMNPNDIKNLAMSPNVQNIVKGLNQQDKDKLIREFSNLSSADIQRKLSPKNLNSFQGMNADDIIKKLKNL